MDDTIEINGKPLTKNWVLNLARFAGWDETPNWGGNPEKLARWMEQDKSSNDAKDEASPASRDVPGSITRQAARHNELTKRSAKKTN